MKYRVEVEFTIEAPAGRHEAMVLAEALVLNARDDLGYADIVDEDVQVNHVTDIHPSMPPTR